MKELTIDAKISNLHGVIGFLDAQLEAMDCPMAAQIQLDMAVEELFVNIANYAYAPGNGAATIRVRTSSSPRSVTVTLIDEGRPFDPTAKPDPDTTLSAQDRSIGGLGIFMAKKSVDEMSYEYVNGQNRLTLHKRF
jgi:anti-sigma regulatory factor (Ser/Thr protein kinase)